MTTTTDDVTLKISRVFNASPEELFEAWTDPAVLVKWWGPEGMTTPHHALDVKAGGRWETTMRNKDGADHICFGTYRAVEPPRRLSFTMRWKRDEGGASPETLVELTFEPAAGGTRLTLVQTGFADQAARDSHNGGWSSSLNDLERLFA